MERGAGGGGGGGDGDGDGDAAGDGERAGRVRNGDQERWELEHGESDRE